jgi:hypothetical protein
MNKMVVATVFALGIWSVEAQVLSLQATRDVDGGVVEPGDDIEFKVRWQPDGFMDVATVDIPLMGGWSDPRVVSHTLCNCVHPCVSTYKTTDRLRFFAVWNPGCDQPPPVVGGTFRLRIFPGSNQPGDRLAVMAMYYVYDAMLNRFVGHTWITTDVVIGSTIP